VEIHRGLTAIVFRPIIITIRPCQRHRGGRWCGGGSFGALDLVLLSSGDAVCSHLGPFQLWPAWLTQERSVVRQIAACGWLGISWFPFEE
jgi:hypothetical protein